MKTASDAQEYRIQRSLLDSEPTPPLDDLCYDLHSTGILRGDLFSSFREDMRCESSLID